MSEIKQLAEKLANVSRDIGKVEKDGKNTFSNYGFISGEKMETILRSALPEHKLYIIPSVKSYEEKEFVNEKNKVAIRTLVMMDFKIIDLETGYSEIHPFFGSDQDTGGKSGGQAITECCKRFYIKLFHVTSSDDIDPDSKTVEVQKKPAPKKPSTPKNLSDVMEAQGISKKDFYAMYGIDTAEKAQQVFDDKAALNDMILRFKDDTGNNN